MLVLLWTDILIWSLLFSIIIIIYKLRKRPDFKMAANQLYNSKTALMSGLILLVYIVIGLLDSVHFRKHIINSDITHKVQSGHENYGDVISILDYISMPWSDVSEKTFAAPFSTVLYVKERVVDSVGNLVEIYPTLSYAKYFDTQSFLTTILLVTTFVTLLIVSLYKFYRYTRNTKMDTTTNNTIFIWSILYIICLLLAIIFSLYNQYHVLGTDKIGTDVMYISLKSVRTGLIIGTITTIFMLPVALLFGTITGYYSGYIDDIIVYIYTTLSSIPGVLLISAFILITQTQIALHPDWFETLAEQADIRLLALCIILGVTSWSGLCRLLRAETLKLKNLDYVTAAKTMHVSSFKIILKHIIPNLVHIIIINIAIDFSSLVLAEAVLSYIGVGVDPTTMSWGNMINSARLELSREPIVWWPILGAFIPMFIFVLSLNLFADELRDAFDPRIRLQ